MATAIVGTLPLGTKEAEVHGLVGGRRVRVLVRVEPGARTAVAPRIRAAILSSGLPFPMSVLVVVEECACARELDLAIALALVGVPAPTTAAGRLRADGRVTGGSVDGTCVSTLREAYDLFAKLRR